MSGGLIQDGYLSPEELQSAPGIPSRDRMRRGPVAVIECVQEIPCNPCEAACPRHAIHVGSPITNCPVLDPEKCTGCGLCVPHCPGLAIFVADLSGPEETAVITFPCEYLPLPAIGEVVDVVDRAGEVVGTGKVLRVVSTRTSDRTAAVTVELPREHVMNVRGMRRRGVDKDGHER
ncbi:MAG: 4Fe-4S binding protein [Candidatus Bipolaricaulis sp.]|nr:4Fe-4S binding protein [Candidatus Bipolaricaulis sp.]